MKCHTSLNSDHELYLTQKQSTPGLFWKQAYIRDRPLWLVSLRSLVTVWNFETLEAFGSFSFRCAFENLWKSFLFWSLWLHFSSLQCKLMTAHCVLVLGRLDFCSWICWLDWFEHEKEHWKSAVSQLQLSGLNKASYQLTHHSSKTKWSVQAHSRGRHPITRRVSPRSLGLDFLVYERQESCC